MSKPSINGEWPKLENRTIEKLIAQEFWCDEKLEDEANVLYIKASGEWYRLYFDDEIVFWRNGSNGLQDETASRNQEFGYPLVDWGHKLGVEGATVSSCTSRLTSEGAQVEFVFSNGRSLAVESIDDQTRIKI